MKTIIYDFSNIENVMDAPEIRMEDVEREVKEGDCDHPFRVPGDMCLNCGQWDTDLVAIRARLRELDERLVAANGRATTAEARAEAAEKKFADERDFAQTLQEECNKAVDDMEAANSRAEQAEARVKEMATAEGRDYETLRGYLDAAEARAEAAEKRESAWCEAALKHYPPNWAFDATNPEAVIANIVSYRAAFGIAQAALSPAEQEGETK